MENASKALIIAGEILIGILVLSLAAYIITQFGSFSRNLNDQISETEISSFNVNFTNYSGRTNISMQEIATIINYAQKNNETYEAEPGDDFYVDVMIGDVSILNENINQFLEQNKNTTYYSCNVNVTGISTTNNENEIQARRTYTNSDIVYNENTRRVISIKFHPIGENETSRNLYSTALLQKYNIVWK